MSDSNYLILLRHGQSEWNLQNRFAGLTDIGLTERGENEARDAGLALRKSGITIDRAWTSTLSRASRTLDLALEAIDSSAPIEVAAQLNERDYGELTGLNKAEVIEHWGAEQIRRWRRSLNERPPGGESLQDTCDRAFPYFEKHIIPRLAAGENCLICAHGNSLRSIVYKIEHLDEKQIEQYEIATGVPVIYRYPRHSELLDNILDFSAHKISV